MSVKNLGTDKNRNSSPVETDRKYEISHVSFKSTKAPPIVAYFENGDLKSDAQGSTKCGIYRNKENPAKYVVAVSSGDNKLYMGEEPGDEEPVRTLIVIQDKGSDKVRMVEVKKVSLHPEHQFLSKTLLSPRAGTHADLYKAFGSKQIKRRTEQRERMNINVETLATRLKEAADNVFIDDKQDIVNYEEFSFSPIPCNRNATDVHEIYNLEDIVLPEELDSLQKEAEKALHNVISGNAAQFSTFFCQTMKKLPNDNQLYRTKILMFVECIVWFLKLSWRDLSKRNPIVCPISEVINKKLLDLFTEESNNGKRTRPPALKDKAVCYAIIACLLAMKFTLDLTPLSAEVKMSVTKLLELSRILGAVSARDKKSVIILKLPLPPKPIPLARRKRKSFS